MSAQTVTVPPLREEIDLEAAPSRGASGRQLLAVMRLEWRRQLLGARVLWLLTLALLPVAVSVAVAFVQVKFANRGADPGELREAFANLYHGLFVRVVLFFGSLTLFLGLIRGEVDARTLHYQFLAPVRRPLLVLGKYCAAVVIGWGFFLPATVLSVAAVAWPAGLGSLLRAPGAGDLLAYCAMTALGCVGYGALFLALGTLLKSPGYLVALYFGFEWFQFLLPPILKQLSIVHYLKALTPFPISEGPFAILAEPKPGWLATLQLLLYAAIAVGIAVVRVRRMEVDYSSR